MTYADDRALREEAYAAYCTRASDQGPNAGQNDNGPVMEEILDLRQELAGLLGFRQLRRAVAGDQDGRVQRPGAQLPPRPGGAQQAVRRPRPEQLRAYAAEQGCTELQSWDAGYYAEKLREARYSVSQEALRAYFPVDKVLSGLFAIVGRLYGIQIRELHDFERWHADVRLFEILGERRARRPLLLRPLCPRQQARRCLDGRRPRPPARRPGPADRPGGLPGVQLHPGGERQAGAADPRRGHYPVPRVRPWPAPPADPRRACRRLRDQRGGLGRRRAAQPVSWRTGAGNRKAWR